ncbi:MAG: carbohydrate-binding domain-containing protein [Termitinemataceae bacterium]|nr:MAG: carbohydrate-binding domain-containing protein [Termitinemataceae bacterium]
MERTQAQILSNNKKLFTAVKQFMIAVLSAGVLLFAMSCEDLNGNAQDDYEETTDKSTDAGNWDGTVDREFSANTDAAAILAAIRALEVNNDDSGYESAVPDSDKDTVVPDITNAISITLSNGNSTTNGTASNNIDINNTDNTITITGSSAETYALSGTLSDGQVIIDVSKSVNLILNGVSITSEKGSPLSLFNSKKKTITLAEGTQNYLTDAAVYTSFYKAADEEPNAALFSKKALSINGTGTLTVNGKNNNGIGCKDNLKIMSGTITISAKNNALKGNDSVVIKGGNINITSIEDGIKSDSEDEGAGYVYIGGEAAVSITSMQDGIQAYRAVHILENAALNIKSGGGATNKTTGYSGTDSCKGIKSDTDLLIEDGTITLNCLDDALHSNNAVLISGGTYAIKTDDDAIHANALTVINGGNISISKSYEGIESAQVIINGGTINLTSSDDGINGSDGSSGTSGSSFNVLAMQRPGNGDHSGGSANTNCAIVINGGNITVNSSGDGIDSNGNVWINGGYVIVHGPSSSGDEALDSDGSFFMDGGTVLAAGPAGGMTQTPPSADSAQYSIVFTFSKTLNEGTSLTLKDSNGKTVANFAAAKSFRTFVITSPNLKNGSTYSLYSGATLKNTTSISSKVSSVTI